MSISDSLEFYRRPAPMTELGHHDPELAATEGDPGALAAWVRQVLVHRDWAPAMGLSFGPDRLADQHIRPVNEVLDRVVELRPGLLDTPRRPEDRMVGVCRHFALLHTALLRRHGTPARARAGFAGYFGPGWVDHWITEYWDGNRWVRHDAQIGELARKTLELDFDPADLPPGRFLTGAEAWLLCRSGQADPDDFGIFDMHGLYFVLGDLLLDLAALNKVELLPWDGLGRGPDWNPDETELADVDRLAEVIGEDDLGSVRAAYARQPVGETIVSFVEGVPTPVRLGALAWPEGRAKTESKVS